MTYCITPGCLTPENHDSAQFCQTCGGKLHLKERYRALKPIGRGGFGRTFLAVDEDIPSKPSCVIKQLYLENPKPNTFAKAQELFQQEAIRLDELGKHPQIPTLLAHFEQNQQLYLIEEFIPGLTLSEELKQQGHYNEDQIWQFLREILPLVGYIHSCRVLHRDIKPDNIIRRQDDGKLVLIDFGVAKLLTDTALLQTGTIIGSPEYMAPEQLKGKAFWASDLYSVGVTCIYLLTQVSPFDLYDAFNETWVWRDFLPLGTKISDRLGKILDQLIHYSLKQRYQSADQVITALTPPTSPPVGTHFINLWHPTTCPIPGNTLTSEVGIDYRRLKQLLVTHKWQQADKETWTLLCQACGKTPGYYLKLDDIHELPCEDLRTLDQLWVKYSKNHFGFTVQSRIYQEVEGDYASFCDRVGWSVYNPHFPDTAYHFNLKAPAGHLPSRRWVGGYYDWWRHAEAIAAKLEQCGLS
ncbi:protein kinase domain-containing protein [Coleofasciculus sp. G2-EDA-02]|uniref:protein kinase domain-containing protein n=1 Tax=Coleofasciculus sp. G2-EDA-02 TaxID=3069529 RepID=UPI0032FDC0D2